MERVADHKGNRDMKWLVGQKRCGAAHPSAEEAARRGAPLFRRLRLLLFLSAGLFAQSANMLEQADEAFRQGNLDPAASLARQALARDPGAVHAHMILGVIAARKSQWDTSTRHFETVIRREPANPYGYFYLGQARLYQQQWEK